MQTSMNFAKAIRLHALCIVHTANASHIGSCLCMADISKSGIHIGATLYRWQKAVLPTINVVLGVKFMRKIIHSVLSIPFIWNIVQDVLGAPKFKRELYLSKLKKECRLLDFGCASGHLSEAFSNFDYTGIDIDEKNIEAARKACTNKPNMRFVAADILSRPFSENQFDEVLMAGTVHHLPEPLFKDILHELHRIVKPGGHIHVFDPVLRPQDGWQQKLLRRLDQGRFTRTTEHILSTLQELRLFSVSAPEYYKPRGQLIQDCDYLYLKLTKSS